MSNYAKNVATLWSQMKATLAFINTYVQQQ